MLRRLYAAGRGNARNKSACNANPVLSGFAGTLNAIQSTQTSSLMRYNLERLPQN
jgi:hypothetical protein